MKKKVLLIAMIVLLLSATLLLSSCEGFFDGLVEPPSNEVEDLTALEKALSNLAESTNFAVNLFKEKGGDKEAYTFEIYENRLKLIRSVDSLSSTEYYTEDGSLTYRYFDVGHGSFVREECEADAHGFGAYRALFSSLAGLAAEIKATGEGEYTLSQEQLITLGYSDLRIKYDGEAVVAIHLEIGKYGEDAFTVIDLSIYKMGQIEYALPDEAPSEEPSDTNALLAEAIMAFLTMKNGSFAVGYQDGDGKFDAEIQMDGDVLYANPNGYEYYRVPVDGTYYYYERNTETGEDFRPSEEAREFFEEAMDVWEKLLNFAKAHIGCYEGEGSERYVFTACKHNETLLGGSVRDYDSSLELVNGRFYICSFVTDLGTYYTKTNWRPAELNVPEHLLKKPEEAPEAEDLSALILAVEKTLAAENVKITRGDLLYLRDGDKRYMDDPRDFEEHYFLYASDGTCLYTYGRSTRGDYCYRYDGFWGDIPLAIDTSYRIAIAAVTESLDSFRSAEDGRYVAENPRVYLGDLAVTRIEITLSGGYAVAIRLVTGAGETTITFSDFGGVRIELPKEYEEYH